MTVLALLALATVLLVDGRAFAHPLGNFTTNRFARLEITPGEVGVHYVVDFAELAAFEEKSLMDVDGGGISAAERAAYADDMAGRLLGGFSLGVDDSSLRLRTVGSTAVFRPGQGGLDTLRLSVDYVAELPQDRGALAFVDQNYTSRLGWKEVVATASGGLRIVESSVPQQSISDELRSYPTDMLEDPLQVTTAHVEFARGDAGLPDDPPPSGAGDGSSDLLGDTFTSLIEPEASPPFLIALALAVALGAIHALGPGHGKLLLAAYLAGTEAKFTHALKVGVAVSLMHTLSVVVVGLLILWGTRLFRPEDVYPWLGLVSGLAVFALGAVMTRRRLRERHRGEHAAGHAHGHRSPPPSQEGPSPSSLGLGTIAMGGGLLPSPSALVVLLGAVALQRTLAGVILVLGFGLGLALALVGLGVAVLRTKSFISNRSGRMTWLPVASSLAISGLGLYLTIRALTTLR